MPPDHFVLYTVYIDEDADDHLLTQSAPLQQTSAALFRRYLKDGIKAARLQPALLTALAPLSNQRPLVLRSIFMSPKVDDRLRVEAFDSGVTKNDLIRRYVRIGMNSAQLPETP